jgi:hypothetical protein
MLTFDIKSTFAGGNPYIPIDLEASREQGKKVYDWENAYDERYAPYFRLDFRIGVKQNGTKISQEWGLDLQNVTNHQNVFMQDYDGKQGSLYTVYQQGFMPMMLYRIRF